MKWLHVGTAPSVLRTLPLFHRSDFRTITTNAGINLVPTPDVYVAIDAVTMAHYRDKAKAAQQSGTHLVTIHRDNPVPERSAEIYDEHVKLSRNDPSLDEFGRFQYSGPFCLEYACHNGAAEIHLIGFDGWEFPGDYYTDGLPHNSGGLSGCRRKGAERTMALRNRCRKLAEVWADVQFVQYGQPRFQVGAPNWQVERC